MRLSSDRKIKIQDLLKYLLEVSSLCKITRMRSIGAQLQWRPPLQQPLISEFLSLRPLCSLLKPLSSISVVEIRRDSAIWTFSTYDSDTFSVPKSKSLVCEARKSCRPQHEFQLHQPHVQHTSRIYSLIQRHVAWINVSSRLVACRTT